MRKMKRGYTYEMIHSNELIDMYLSYNLDHGSVVNKHVHDWIEIVYLMEGSLEFFINNRKYNLEAFDFIVVNSMEVHSTVCKESNKAIILQIPVKFLSKYLKDVYLYHYHVDMNTNVVSQKSAINKIRKILDELYSGYTQKEEGYILTFYSNVFLLLNILIKEFSIKRDVKEYLKSKKNEDRMQRIIDYVTDHYDEEEISLKSISKFIGLHPVYFSRYFKEQMGVTFLEYVSTVRLERIYQDVLNTDLTIKEIQERHGFYNYKLFVKMFKKTYGTTPLQLRKKYLESSNIYNEQ